MRWRPSLLSPLYLGQARPRSLWKNPMHRNRCGGAPRSLVVYIYSTLLSLRAATFVLRVKQELVTRIKGHRGGKAAITWQHECEHCELTVQAARCDRRYLLSGMTRASRWSHVISKSSGLYVVACHFEEPSFTMRPGVRHKGHGKVMLPTRLAAAIWTARHDSQIVPHP